jgi:hypothetical protein
LDDFLAQGVVVWRFLQLLDHLLQLFTRGLGVDARCQSQEGEGDNDALSGIFHDWFSLIQQVDRRARFRSTKPCLSVSSGAAPSRLSIL